MRQRHRLPRSLGTALGIALLGVVGTASGAVQVTSVTTPPAQIVGTPVLITVKGTVGVDRPTAYAFFRLSKHLHEPRLIVAGVKGKTGRTYAVRGTSVRNCYESALRLQGSPAGHLQAGKPYRLSFIARTTAHQPTTGKKPFATFTVKAQARPLVRATVHPECPH